MLTAPRTADARLMAGTGSRFRACLSRRPRAAAILLVATTAALSPFLSGSSAATEARAARPAAQSGTDFSLSFNGVDAYVKAPDSPSLRPEKANAFTVAFWTSVRKVDNNVLPRFFEKGGDFLCVMGDRSNPRFGTIGLEVANASGTGNTNGGASEFWGSTRLQLNRWYFVAVTFDGNRASAQAQMYLDGAPEKTTNVYPWSGRLGSTTGKPWFIGRRAKDLARALDGRLDAMLVYSFALSSTQIQQLYRGQVPRGSSADWEFDEGSGVIARDSSGKGNDAAVVGAVFVVG
jgi:hypothetical protein